MALEVRLSFTDDFTFVSSVILFKALFILY